MLDSLMLSKESQGKALDFLTVFGVPYKSSTYSENRKAWDAACAGKQAYQWIASGRTWAQFYSFWRPRHSHHRQ